MSSSCCRNLTRVISQLGLRGVVGHTTAVLSIGTHGAQSRVV